MWSLGYHTVGVVESLSRVRLLRPRGLQPVRLLCLWDLPGKDTGVGCHFLLQEYDINERIYKTEQTHRHREQTCDCHGGAGGRGGAGRTVSWP